MSEQRTLDEISEGTSIESDEVRSSLDETSLGEIPKDWQQVRLKDVIHESNYGAAESAEDFDPGNPRYVRITDINTRGRLKSHTKVSLSKEKADGYLLKKGNLLFARSGASVGKTYLYRQQDGDCVYAGYLINHHINTDLANPEFLYQYTDSPNYDSWVARIQRTGAQPNINAQEYGNLLIPYPPLPEQRKIATILYTVDQAIEKTEEIIDKLEMVRRGTEQDLLSRGILEDGSLRSEENIEYKSSWVDEVPEDWVVQPYSELISDSSVGIVVKPTQYYDEAGEVPILRSKDISRDGIVNGDFEYMTQESNEENSNSQLEAGDVITVRSGEPGLSCVVSPEFDGSNCADLLISTPGDNLDPHYAAMWINSRAGRKQIDRFQAGLAQKHFNLGALRKLRVAVPPIEEQQRIVESVSSITESIDREHQYKTRLQCLKQGLMQDLLSGTVRTADTNIAVPDEIAQHG
ncbi:restriction endonuclease subunit S [Natrarchaeobius halalkaliphilus]|uniref:Restriction endonuclease subunit S n=1 Tax=Natrarchaeobius halalkaliphilus TaxID=1679091 RepID=A0A3N6LYX3_9EURY|nr:restriction endonuclease subunit S [Natrarchaeobius halalkaliphilus]RQG93084.1 restriction endonuclease subunit S [Natrarchaeobius halalkaliphilus]